MRKIDPEVVNAEGRGVVVLQDTSQHHELVKANRILLVLVFTLMIFVFVLGFLILPDYDLVDQVKSRQPRSEAVLAVQNPVLSDEINTLKSQLVGLVSGSIESKLRTLEKSIRMGSISASLGTIEDLKNDVRVLRSYSEPTARKKVTENRLSEEVIRELGQLKRLIYLTFASCGLMLAGIAAFWLRNRFRLKYQGHRYYLGQKK